MKIKSFILLSLIALANTAHCQLPKQTPPPSFANPMNENLKKVMLVQNAIGQLYVDSTDMAKITEDAIRGMVRELDPHSTYTPAKDVKALTESLDGSFEGIGIDFNMSEDTAVVIQPYSGGPSEKAGLQSGDKIITINGNTVSGVQMSGEAVQLALRGLKGSEVKLGVIRPGVKGMHEFTVTRAKIPVYTIDAYYMVEPTIGYIRIASFGATTHSEFTLACEHLQSQGMQDLIIDLQGNGGGYLQSAVSLANEFLENGEMIVYTEGRATGRKEYRARPGMLKLNKVVLLVDGLTASAAEILSGAFQDNDRGIIVGRRTFAKGLVQRPVELPDGSLIRLTIAHYYSPSGRCLQKPYVKGDKSSYNKDLENRFKRGELTNADSIHFADSLKYKTSIGRTVYGGGGVMPDVFVPVDTTFETPLYNEIATTQCIKQATLKYLDINRQRLMKEYDSDTYHKEKANMAEGLNVNYQEMRKGFELFKSKFQIPQEMVNILTEKIKESNIKYTKAELQRAMPALKLQMKAFIAWDLWSKAEFYETINPYKGIYKQGVEAIKNETLFGTLKKKQ